MSTNDQFQGATRLSTTRRDFLRRTGWGSGGLAASWEGSADFTTWTFKLRQGVKWHNVPPLNGRELVADDIKYCYEAYAQEGVQAFTFQDIDGMETPDKYTIRIHLKTPNTGS